MSRPAEASETSLTMGQLAGLVFTFAHVWALPLELLLRHRFGRRYIDGWLLAAALWPILFCALLMPQFQARWSFWMFGLVLALGAFHRWAAILSESSQRLHTQYNGRPHLCWLFGLEEMSAKSLWENTPALLIAWFSIIASPSMAVYFFGGWIALRLKYSMNEFYAQTQADDMRDALYEQQALAERLRQHT